MDSQHQHANQFRQLHEQGCFVIPNPRDAGSARVMAGYGFKALATTSAGLAFSLGARDGEGQVSVDRVLANAREIIEATGLPVSADLENGYSNDPRKVGDTILQAAAAGLVGGSIEDTTADLARPIRDFALAVDCVQAAVDAKRSLDFDFTLTARAENFLFDRPDLDDTIRRLQAFEQAGADVLFAPGLTSAEAIREVVNALERPVNVVMGLQGVMLDMQQLESLGVRRVSLGSSLSRAAFGGLISALDEISGQGSFTFSDRAVPFGDLNDRF